MSSQIVFHQPGILMFKCLNKCLKGQKSSFQIPYMFTVAVLPYICYLDYLHYLGVGELKPFLEHNGMIH